MNMSETVDRGAVTQEPGEDEEVNRVGSTEEPEVDRDASTQEPSDSTRLILHVHPTEKQSLLKGLPQEPQKYALGQSIILGRGEDVNIFLNDQLASRKHIELTFGLQQGCFKVKNIGRQLLINNFDTNTGTEHYLRTNDVIKIANLTFTAEIIVGNDNASFILEFKRGSRGPNPAQVPQHQPVYPVSQYPAQTNPHFPRQIHQPPLPGFTGIPAVPIAVAAYPSSFPVAMQPISPNAGPASNPMYQQHYPPYGQVDNRRQAYQSGRSASENDDSHAPQLSVEETQPPKPIGSSGE